MATAASEAQAQNIVIQNSDHISLLAKQNNFLTWKTVWKENGPLKAKRKNPNMLFKSFHADFQGDTLTIPALNPEVFSGATESKHDFKALSDKLFLRLRILKEDFTALVGAQYKLTIGSDIFRGKTNDKGQLEAGLEETDAKNQGIPLTSQTALLEIVPQGSTAPPGFHENSAGATVHQQQGAAPPPPAPPPGPDAPPPPPPITFKLHIGRLNPIKDAGDIPDNGISGLQQRLNNLGFNAGVVDGKFNDSTKQAMKAFQRTFGLTETDTLDDPTKAKIIDVHDKPDSLVTPVKVKKEETAIERDAPTMTEDQKKADQARLAKALKPPEAAQTMAQIGDDMGQVAPDHDDRKHFNTLRVPPIYRISVRFIDDIDLIFPETTGMDKGLAARLQALEYFTFPLDHVRTTNAAITKCWTYFKDKQSKGTTDPQARTKLKEMLQNEILEDGRLPVADKNPPGSGTKKPDSRRINLPGGYTFFRPNTTYHLGDHRFRAEGTYYVDAANPVLGKIPLVVRIEKLGIDGKWRRAERVWVYCQLRKPDDWADIAPERKAPDLRTTAPGGPGGSSHPSGYFNGIKGQNAPAAEDPQVDNAHHTKGGKREGAGNANKVTNLFETANKLKGFHIAPDGAGRTLGHAEYKLCEDGSSDIKYSVKVQTNEEGEAGFLFLPSRVGSDRYKFRFFVGPGTLASDGKEIETNPKVSHIVESGTLVVWRIMRLAQFLEMPVSNTVADEYKNQVKDVRPSWYTSGLPPRSVTDRLYKFLGLKSTRAGQAHEGLSTVDISPTSHVVTQFKKAYIDLKVECVVEPLTVAKWQAAFNYAKGRAAASWSGRARWHLDALLECNTDVPFLIHCRTPKAYNAKCTALGLAGRRKAEANPPAGDITGDMDSLLTSNMMGDMMDHITDMGDLPGLTVVRAPLFDSLGVFDNFGGWGGSSGRGMRQHGCFVFFGVHLYNRTGKQPNQQFLNAYTLSANSLESNTVHEMGHCVYGLHQEKGGAGGGDTTLGVSWHDTNDNCVMSYMSASHGEFCGKCVMMLRGWDINAF